MTRTRPRGAEAEARIRLEGALEVVERAAARTEQLARRLSARSWRRDLLLHPEDLAAARDAEASLPEAMNKLARFCEADATSAADEVRRRNDRARKHLRSALTQRLRHEVPSIGEGIAQLQRRLLDERPTELRPDEHPVAEAKVGSLVWLFSLIFLWQLLFLNGLAWLTHAPPPPLWLNALLGVLAAAPVAAWTRVSGRVTVTNQRVIVRRRFATAVQVELSNLPSDAVHPGNGFVRIDALEPLWLWELRRDVESLFPALESARFLVRRPHVPGEPAHAAVFAATATDAHKRRGEPGVAVVTGRWAAFFPRTQLPFVIGEITGAGRTRPRDVAPFFRRLRALPDDDFERQVRQAAARRGFMLEGPRARVDSDDPVWRALVLTDDRHTLRAKIGFGELADVEAALHGWRR